MTDTNHEIKIPVSTIGTGLFCFLCRVLPMIGMRRRLVGRLASIVVFVRLRFPWGATWKWGPRFLDLDADKS